MIIKRYQREIKFHRVTADMNRIHTLRRQSLLHRVCVDVHNTNGNDMSQFPLPWHECVPERQTVLFVGDTSGKTSRCSPVVIIHGTAPRIRDRNEFSRVWIDKKSSDRVTSRSRDGSPPKTGQFSFQIQRSYLYCLHHRLPLDDCEMKIFFFDRFFSPLSLNSNFVGTFRWVVHSLAKILDEIFVYAFSEKLKALKKC